MITDTTLVIDYLSKWLAKYIKNAGRDTFVVGYRGARSDAFTLHLCSKACELGGGLSTMALCFDIDSSKLKPIYKGLISLVQPSPDYVNGDEFNYLQCNLWAADNGGKNNGIVVGTIDKTFGTYFRSYGKCEEATADIFPLFDLNYSDIIKITNELWPDIKWPDWEGNEYAELAILVEFCNEAEDLYGIITNEDPPNKHPRWPFFVNDQKKILAQVHQREKKTRHKILNKPYPQLPSNLICRNPGQ
jgi:hypothetical protein